MDCGKYPSQDQNYTFHVLIKSKLGGIKKKDYNRRDN